jgi:predicted DNA-binding protein (UPF0251 family)
MFNSGQTMRGPYRRRRVQLPPRFKNFKPSGVPRKTIQSITLSVDEYEAIRLADHLGMDHLAASGKMNISRPTFTRLIEQARQKVAHAIVEGMELIIEGGNVDFSSTFYRCRECGGEQTGPVDITVINCPECGSVDVQDLGTEEARRKRNRKGKH